MKDTIISKTYNKKQFQSGMERETHNCPCDECNGSEYPHHELDEAYEEVGIEAIVAAEKKKELRRSEPGRENLTRKRRRRPT